MLWEESKALGELNLYENKFSAGIAVFNPKTDEALKIPTSIGHFEMA